MITILRETCSCGATTEAAFQSMPSIANDALAVWRREHRHEQPARSVVRIPLARRRA